MAANELVKLDGIIMSHLMRLGSGQFHFVFTATASRELRDTRREENNSEASSYAGITALKTFGQFGIRESKSSGPDVYRGRKRGG